jgi:hypothetical protein
VEESVTSRVITRMSSMDGMAGDDITMFDAIAERMDATSSSANSTTR